MARLNNQRVVPWSSAIEPAVRVNCFVEVQSPRWQGAYVFFSQGPVDRGEQWQCPMGGCEACFLGLLNVVKSNMFVV